MTQSDSLLSNPARIAIKAAEAVLDKKAEKVKILDVRNCCSFTDYFLICSAVSDRQVKAIADNVLQTLKTSSLSPLSSEGYSEGRWVVIDYGELIVHIFMDALRDYYRLDELWAQALPVEIPSELYHKPSPTSLPIEKR